MKKYVEPKIKAIMLDPDQAVLEVCKVGGVYFTATASQCTQPGTFRTAGVCVDAVRDVKGISITFAATRDAMPS